MLSFIKKEKEHSKNDEMLENLRLAHKEWKDKESFFEVATDPDLIDYAIYDMEASKLKYIYLLKKMREMKEHNEDTISQESEIKDTENISINS